MNFKFKNKKVVIFTIVIILILIIGGVFWWQNRGGSVRDFSIKDVPGGKFVENKREGLKVKVPSEWKTEKTETVSFSQWGVNFLSPDITFDPHYILKKGCMVEVNIENSNLNFDLTNKRIQSFSENLENKPTLKEEGYEIFEVSQKRAVKELVYDNAEIGIEIAVRIPRQKDKNVFFVLRSSFEDKERCMQEFDRLLDTVEVE